MQHSQALTFLNPPPNLINQGEPMKIPEHTINELNTQADLVSIIKKHTNLKPAGREFKGRCPFHGEKTPSFFVNPQNNLYHCFGCGAKGNAISFLMDYERLSFMEAIKELATQTGIALPKEDTAKYTYQRTNANGSSSKPSQNKPNQKTPSQKIQGQNNKPNQKTPSQHPNTPPHPKNNTTLISKPNASTSNNNNNSTNNNGTNNTNANNNTNNILPAASSPKQEATLYDLLIAVGRYYQQQLHQHKYALDYFTKRGLSLETINTFELGFAPDGWQHLIAAFPHDIEGLKILGLIKSSQNGNWFDFLRNRVIFPIKDKQGRIVGFAGRALADDVMPKYMNSSDSVVFQKNQLLYGYYEARQKKASKFLVVEGYMDVIALHQAGIYGAIAPMGTAINENQLAYLFRFNDTLTLCFDGDTAGQKAALRTLDVAMPILQDGKQIKFLVLPDNHDPDTFVAAYGKDKMQSAINTATSLSDFLYNTLASQYDLKKTEQKSKAMGDLKELTSKLPKGSSLRWLLNKDIFERLRSAKHSHRKTNNAYQAQISVDDQFLLCLLYEPTLLDDNALNKIYKDANLALIDFEFQHKKNKNTDSLPALPSWQELKVTGLSQIIATIHTISPTFETIICSQIDANVIDFKAQMILTALEDGNLKHRLSQQWREFLYHTQQNQLNDITLLFNELLCSVLINTLEAKQKSAKDLLSSSLYKKRILALKQWDKNTIKSAIQSQG